MKRKIQLCIDKAVIDIKLFSFLEQYIKEIFIKNEIKLANKKCFEYIHNTFVQLYNFKTELNHTYQNLYKNFMM